MAANSGRQHADHRDTSGFLKALYIHVDTATHDSA